MRILDSSVKVERCRSKVKIDLRLRRILGLPAAVVTLVGHVCCYLISKLRYGMRRKKCL